MDPVVLPTNASRFLSALRASQHLSFSTSAFNVPRLFTVFIKNVLLIWEDMVDLKGCCQYQALL